MTKFVSFCRLLLLIAALVFTTMSFLPAASAQVVPEGSCKDDCGCDPGWAGCCLLPNGAVCYRAA
jgi:hypothetical protein